MSPLLFFAALAAHRAHPHALKTLRHALPETADRIAMPTTSAPALRANSFNLPASCPGSVLSVKPCGLADALMKQ